MVLCGQRLEEHSDPGVDGEQGVCGEPAGRTAKAGGGKLGLELEVGEVLVWVGAPGRAGL